MATFSRNATVDWKGSLLEGSGEAKAGTGAFSLPVTFPRRIGDPQGVTSPEELIAAAHAVCFAQVIAASHRQEGRIDRAHVGHLHGHGRQGRRGHQDHDLEAEGGGAGPERH